MGSTAHCRCFLGIVHMLKSTSYCIKVLKTNPREKRHPNPSVTFCLEPIKDIMVRYRCRNHDGPVIGLCGNFLQESYVGILVL